MASKIAIILIIFLSLITGFYIYQNKLAPCKNPIYYQIGGFDNRFGITHDKFLLTINEAEDIWEGGADLELFEYRSDGKFKINLVFDERQESTIDANRSKVEITDTKAQYDLLVKEYDSLSFSYQSSLAVYNQNAATLASRLEIYNNRVSNINAQGGATPKEYNELEKEKQELEKMKSALDFQRTVLNGKASELNSLGDSINVLAKKLNINVDIHNQRYGEAREFDQGEYRGDEINIYQFETIGDLRLVLAHELGHALGIEHVENPESIMYFLMDKQNIQSPALSREDLQALNGRCNL